MGKGKRANLERLLRSAWERQHQLQGVEGRTYTVPNTPTELAHPKFDWRDLSLAGFALLIEALALLYGVSILTIAAAALLWFALRGYRRERNFQRSLRSDISSAVLLVMATTVIPIGAKMYIEHRPGPLISGPTSKPPDVSYPPTPDGRLQRMDASLVVPSSHLCQGMPDAAQIDCLCPRPLKYDLAALPTPSDNNYATQVKIHAVREPIYRLRLFSRTEMYSGAISASPYGKGQAAVAVGEYAYDRYSITMQSSKPEHEFTVELRSSEGLRLKCINQEN